jgi:predicted small integral membrane protein
MPLLESSFCIFIALLTIVQFLNINAFSTNFKLESRFLIRKVNEDNRRSFSQIRSTAVETTSVILLTLLQKVDPSQAKGEFFFFFFGGSGALGQ